MGCCISRQLDQELINVMEKYLENQKISENEKNELKSEVLKKIDTTTPISDNKSEYIERNKTIIIREINNYVVKKYAKEMRERVSKFIDIVASMGYLTEGDKVYIKEYYYNLTRELIDYDKDIIKNFSDSDKARYVDEMRKHLEKLQIKVTDYIKKHSKDEIAKKTGTCINQNTLEYLLVKIKWNYK